MELCFQLHTFFIQESHKRKLKSDLTRLPTMYWKSFLTDKTHTFELKVPLTPNWKSFYFQLKYRQLPPLSALSTLISTYLPSATPLSALSCFYSLTQFIAQNDLLSAKQQSHVLCRIFAWSSTNPSARNSLWSFSGTNGHPNLSLAHGGSDAKGFQRTSYDASSHHREPTWNNANSRFVAQPVDDFLFPWEEAGSAENPITIDEDESFSETMTPPILQVIRCLLKLFDLLKKQSQLGHRKHLTKESISFVWVEGTPNS